MISSLENFSRMMNRDHPHWLPLNMSFTPPLLETIRQHIGDKDPVEAFGLDFRATGIPDFTPDPRWRDAFEKLGFVVPENAHVGYCGITKSSPDLEDLGSATHLTEMCHPLSVVSDPEQLKSLPWPVMNEDGATRLRAHADRAHAEGRVAVGSLECTVFEVAWYLRGMDNLLLDLADENGIGDFLLDRLTQRSIEGVRVACRSGIDVIGLGDDVGTQRGMMMSVDFWRTHLKGRLKRVIDAIRDAQTRKIYIRYHSDGDIRPIVDDLIEIGIDILNPVQPECMPPDEVIPKYRDRLAFWGMIGTQTVMPFGTTREVEQALGQCAEFARQGTAVVVAPTHVLEPDVPWANIAALAGAAGRTRLR